ncbi:MAG: hypothetical protein IPF90_11780 [Actinomycetales bacterium]|jgi:hypothetical protein|nr:hypothetical protein [Candidatus Phosphoribacter baldrii]
MALDVGTLVAYLKLDVSDVGVQVRRMQDDVRRSMNDMDKTTTAGTSKMTTTVASMAKRVGGLMAGAFVVERVVDFFKSSIDAAGEANAAVQRSSIVFGANSKTIEAWAKGAARNFGISEQAAISSAASFGDMFAQIGFTSAAAAGMSKDVVALAADLGAFKGMKTEDVLERIAAGFRGEYDSLQVLVPSISAAAIEQQALTATGKKSADSLTSQEKAAATLAVVMKGAGNATGFYAKHAQDKAQVEKTAAAATEELVAKVGQRLLPAYTALVSFGRDHVIPFLSGTVDVVSAGADALAPMASAVGALASGFRDLPGPIQGSLVGMLAFILLKDRLAAVGTTIKTDMVSALDTVRLKAMYAGDAATAAGGGFRGMASAIGASAGAGLRGAASGLLGVLGGPWGAAFTGATALVGLWLQKQADARRRVEELTSAIEADSGALGENTRQKLVNQLETDGVLQAARTLGISVSDVTAAILDDTDALARVNEALARTGEIMTSQGDQAFRQYEGEINTVTGAVEGQTAAITEAKAAIERKRDALVGITPKVDAFGNTIQSAGDKTGGAASKIETLADKLDRLSGDTLDAREASRRYEQAVDDLADALKEADKGHVKTADRMNTSTEAGRRLQSALDNVAETTMKSAKADLTRGDSLDVVIKRVEDARQGFIANAIQMGYSEKAANSLADQFGLTTLNVQALSMQISKVPPVKLSINQEIFNAAMADVRAQLSSLSGVATVTARLNATALKNELKLLQNGVNPSTAANGLISVNGVRAMAAGDVTRQASIMRRMAPILWNEAPGGEAYIPLASSKRARSTKILAETNRLMGDPLGVNGGAGQTALALSPSALEGAVRNGMRGMTVRFDRVSAVGDYVLGVLDSAQSREAAFT